MLTVPMEKEQSNINMGSLITKPEGCEGKYSNTKVRKSKHTHNLQNGAPITGVSKSQTSKTLTSDPRKTQTPGCLENSDPVCLENSDPRKTQTPGCLENSDPRKTRLIVYLKSVFSNIDITLWRKQTPEKLA